MYTKTKQKQTKKPPILRVTTFHIDYYGDYYSSLNTLHCE